MTDRPSSGCRVRVLSNATVVHSNPWLGSWLDASHVAGVDVQDLSLGAVLGRGDATPAGAHLQWPERMLNPASPLVAGKLVARLLALCALLRLRGKRVLLTAHNVRSHDRRHPILERVLWFALDRLVTDVHALAAAGRDEVVGAHPPLARRRWHVVPHGDYLTQAHGAPTQSAARETLDLPVQARVLAAVGTLRRYKGVGDLIEAFTSWQAADARLIIAGRTASAEDAEELQTVVQDECRIHLTTEYIDEPTLLRVVAAADLVVLPYREVLNSGSALYALSACRQILVPHTSTFAELSDHVGPGWVKTYKGCLSADDLDRAAKGPAPEQPPELKWYSWDTVTKGIAEMWRVQ